MSICINVFIQILDFSIDHVGKIGVTLYKNRSNLKKNVPIFFNKIKLSFAFIIENPLVILLLSPKTLNGHNAMFRFGGIHLWKEDITQIWLERLNEIEQELKKEMKHGKRYSFNGQGNKKTRNRLSTDWIANISNGFNLLNVELSFSDFGVSQYLCLLLHGPLG